VALRVNPRDLGADRNTCAEPQTHSSGAPITLSSPKPEATPLLPMYQPISALLSGRSGALEQ